MTQSDNSALQTQRAPSEQENTSSQHVIKTGTSMENAKAESGMRSRDFLMILFGAVISVFTVLLAQYLQSSSQSDQLEYERRVDLLMDIMSFHNESTLRRTRSLAEMSALLPQNGLDPQSTPESINELERALDSAMREYQVIEDQYRARMAMYVPIVGVVFGVDANALVVDPNVYDDTSLEDLMALFSSPEGEAFVSAEEAMWEASDGAWLEGYIQERSVVAAKLEIERVRVNEELDRLVSLLTP